MELANRSIMTMQNYKPFNKLDAISAAPQWDATTTYHENDPVVYKGRYYRCNASPSATVGTWVDTEWTAVALAVELDDKAPLASPAFTGAPTAPTPTSGDNSTKVATTAFVKTAIDGISVTPLSGNTYDFSTNADVYKAVADIARALGATVANAPTDPVSTSSND